MVDRMMTSSLTSRVLKGQGRDPNISKPVISKMARDRDSVLTWHHLPPQPHIKGVKIHLARYMHSLSAF